MLISLSLVLLFGFSFGMLVQRMKLPPLLGMLLAGIALGPYVINLLAPQLLSISADLRQIALIIILMRAGLALNLDDIRQVGRPAILLCFVPACFEIAGILLLAPPLLGVSLLDAAVMGAVLAAVSPAVVVPKMLALMEQGYGTEKGIPQMIMAGASVDDVFVIVLFTTFTGLAQGSAPGEWSLLRVPVSIATGIAAGLGIGLLLAWLFARVRLRDSAKLLVLLGIAFLLLGVESASVAAIIPFSGLLAIMALGVSLRKRREVVARSLSGKLSKLWVGAEVLLFVLVGAAVDVRYVAQAGLLSVLLVLGGLMFRMGGVFVSLLGTPLARRERLFCMIAYCPKATVQAAIGAVPLGLGMDSGHIILTVAVLSIMITAPLGALGIDANYARLLQKA